jgi:hypothetical protein
MSTVSAPRAAVRRLVVTAADGSRALVDVDLAESPLAWLASRRDRDGSPLIGASELAAGERFRLDYTRAGLMGRTTMNWDAFAGRAERGGGRGGAGLASDRAIDAGARVRRAIAALGPELAGVVIDVCCELIGLAEVERRHSWPQRSGKVVLRLALAALARHYGLDETATGRAGAPVGRWGSSDFRPGGAPPRPTS